VHQHRCYMTSAYTTGLCLQQIFSKPILPTWEVCNTDSRLVWTNGTTVHCTTDLHTGTTLPQSAAFCIYRIRYYSVLVLMQAVAHNDNHNDIIISRLCFCHTGTLTLYIVTRWSGSNGTEAYPSGQLASLRALMLLIGPSGLYKLSPKGPILCRVGR